MRRKSRILLWELLVCVLFCTSCRGAAEPPAYFGYRDSEFHTELRGELHGVAFCAQLHARPIGTGYSIVLTYLADPQTGKNGALTGTEISATLDTSGEPVEGSLFLRCGDLQTEIDADTAKGWLLPATALFRAGELLRVQRDGVQYLLQTGEGEQLVLDSNGTPRAFSSSRVRFDAVWWEEVSEKTEKAVPKTALNAS